MHIIIIIIIKFKLTTWLLQLIRQMNLQMLSLFYHIAWWIRVGAANGLYSSAFVLHYYDYIPDKVYSTDIACFPSSMLSKFLASWWMPLSPATTLSLCDNNECHAHNLQLTSPSCRFKFPSSSTIEYSISSSVLISSNFIESTWLSTFCKENVFYAMLSSPTCTWKSLLQEQRIKISRQTVYDLKEK